jgi:hypothetical protein
MKIGIMQPYLFPYIGYFQLINAVDKFVIHDDVQYIKGGWINRNRIQIGDKDYLFTFSLKNDSSLKNINTRFLSDQFVKEKIKFLKILKNNYKKSPFFQDAYDLLSRILDYKELNVSLFIFNSLRQICNYLEIKTPCYLSSELNKNNGLRGQDRVIDICNTFKAETYINLIGGKTLYSQNIFKQNNISLFFLETKNISYESKRKHNIPNLSIIDVMMFSSKEKIKEYLNFFYTLV